ncbi:Uncharacterised protein [Vibrio cholerae]|nr:Uncharacterised protein [Vibrio cholerae]CSI29170.1 Uncharacterised protein [Vibrio cholerae]
MPGLSTSKSWCACFSRPMRKPVAVSLGSRASSSVVFPVPE